MLRLGKLFQRGFTFQPREMYTSELLDVLSRPEYAKVPTVIADIIGPTEHSVQGSIKTVYEVDGTNLPE